MRTLALLCILALLAAAPARGQGRNATCSEAAPVPDGYELAFEDDFDGPAGSRIDTARWRHRSLGERRDAVNAKNAVALDGDGHLVIRTYTEGDTHYTGMIRTQETWQYGVFVACVDFGGAPGVFQDVWLQTPTIGEPMGDPGAAGVEIDLVEYRVVDGWNGDRNIAGRGYTNMHWDGYDEAHRSKGSRLSEDLNLDEGFHAYTLQWTPEKLAFYYDGTRVQRVRSPIPHRPEYLILSAEVQDDFWAGDIPPGGYGSYATTTTRMVVDYVRVYQKKPRVATARQAARRARDGSGC